MRSLVVALLPLAEYFYKLVNCLQQANAVLPNHVMTGFAVSFAICSLLFLPILCIVLRMIWAIAEVGPARKTMTSFFIVFLGVPLYPILTALLLALLWLGIGCSMLILSSFGPAAILFWLMVRLWEFSEDFVESELEKSSDMQINNQSVEDISCWELACGLFIGALSCCSFGMLAFALTVLKSPLVILSFVLRFMYESLCRWLVLVHCGCRPLCTMCVPYRMVQVGGEDKTIQELRSQGFSAKDLQNLGVDVGDLYAAGFSILELSEAFHHRDFDSAGLEIEWQWHKHGGCSWWGWFPLVFLTWLSALVCLIAMLMVAIAVVSCAKLIVAVIWPAYIAAGWLRIVAQARRRTSARNCCQPLVQGLKAGYQVVWASSMLTNVCISNRTLWAKWELLQQTVEECLEFAKGDREELSPNLQSLSIFPPVLVGLFHDSWDLYLRTLAHRLRVSPDIVHEAWRSLARQMIWMCQAAVAEDLITDEWVQEVPGGLTVGLPARAFLQAVERSSHRKLVLAGGLTITEDKVAELGAFARQVWKLFCETQDARNAAASVLSQDVHRLLCARLLAGGEDSNTLPRNLAEAVQEYEDLPEESKGLCQAVLSPLMAFGLECGKQGQFKEKLKLVIESLPHLGSESVLHNFGAPLINARGRSSETQYVFAAPLADTGV